jgi:outer membrane biosynthesis protein TonB
MQANHRRAIALSLGALLVALLIGAEQWLQNRPLLQPDQVEVRSIELSAPPPPPPPPKPQTQQQSTARAVELELAGGGASVELGTPEIDVQLQVAEPEVPELTSAPEWSSQLSVNWEAFGLAELDQLPQVVNSPRTVFPNALVRRGVTQATVELDVMIDEQGRVSLRGVRSNPYPELRPLIDKVVQKTRFTSPTKQGQPVRAVFTWPVEFAK